jgi:hypothetical protein
MIKKINKNISNIEIAICVLIFDLFDVDINKISKQDRKTLKDVLVFCNDIKELIDNIKFKLKRSAK